MRLLYDNKFLDATISASSENPNYIATNMQNTILAKVYRSVTTSTVIKISTSVKASYCSILGHNFTSTVSITLQGNNTDSWDSPSFEETIPYRSDMCILNFTEATYNYWRILITDDDSLADGYIEIGSIFLGTFLQMPGMKLDQQLEKKTKSSISISYSGQACGEERYSYRNPAFSFPFLTHDQRDYLNDMYENNKNIKPLICLVWANDLNIESPMYCVIDQDSMQFKRNEDASCPWGTKIKFREVF